MQPGLNQGPGKPFDLPTFESILPVADKLNTALQTNGPLAAAFNDLFTVPVGNPRANDGSFRQELFNIAGGVNQGTGKPFDLTTFESILPVADKLNTALQTNGSLAAAFNNL